MYLSLEVDQPVDKSTLFCLQIFHYNIQLPESNLDGKSLSRISYILLFPSFRKKRQQGILDDFSAPLFPSLVPKVKPEEEEEEGFERLQLFLLFSRKFLPISYKKIYTTPNLTGSIRSYFIFSSFPHSSSSFLPILQYRNC